MTQVEYWPGMKPSAGNQTEIRNLFRSNRNKEFTTEDVVNALNIPKGTASACLSILVRTGWVQRVADGVYKSPDYDPVEDRSQVMRSKPRIGTKASTEMIPGEEYIVKCLTTGTDGNPVIQMESGVIYHGLRKI